MRAKRAVFLKPIDRKLHGVGGVLGDVSGHDGAQPGDLESDVNGQEGPRSNRRSNNNPLLGSQVQPVPRRTRPAHAATGFNGQAVERHNAMDPRRVRAIIVVPPTHLPTRRDGRQKTW